MKGPTEAPAMLIWTEENMGLICLDSYEAITGKGLSGLLIEQHIRADMEGSLRVCRAGFVSMVYHKALKGKGRVMQVTIGS